MTDITNRDLEAALLDQKVAGAFAGKSYAYVAVVREDGWALGIAVQGEDGYNPILGKTFPTQEAAHEWADGLNQHIGLTPRTACNIIASTMQKRRPDPDKWD